MLHTFLFTQFWGQISRPILHLLTPKKVHLINMIIHSIELIKFRALRNESWQKFGGQLIAITIISFFLTVFSDIEY